jgi:hypothetical protein
LEAVGTWDHLANKRAAYSSYTHACSAAAAAATAVATSAATAQQHTASAVALRATADALEAVSVAAAHAAAVALKAARDAQTAAHEVTHISAYMQYYLNQTTQQCVHQLLHCTAKSNVSCNMFFSQLIAVCPLTVTPRLLDNQAVTVTAHCAQNSQARYMYIIVHYGQAVKRLTTLLHIAITPAGQTVHRSLIFCEHCWSQPDEAASETYSINDSSSSSFDSSSATGSSYSAITSVKPAVVLAHGSGERVPAWVAVGADNEGIAPPLRPEMRG